MATLYQSPRGLAVLDQRGFLEVIINEHAMLSGEDADGIVKAMIQRDIRRTSVLMTRIPKYTAPLNYNVIDLHRIGELQLTRIAYYAPTPGDQTFSHLMGHTAFRDVPYRVFVDRAPAIVWLLESADGAPV